MNSSSATQSENLATSPTSLVVDFKTAPLDGLLECPLDQMSLNELREKVQQWRQERQNRQTWRASINLKKEQTSPKADNKPLKAMDEFAVE
jgi:hypothetical protein